MPLTPKYPRSKRQDLDSFRARYLQMRLIAQTRIILYGLLLYNFIHLTYIHWSTSLALLTLLFTTPYLISLYLLHGQKYQLALSVAIAYFMVSNAIVGWQDQWTLQTAPLWKLFPLALLFQGWIAARRVQQLNARLPKLRPQQLPVA